MVAEGLEGVVGRPELEELVCRELNLVESVEKADEEVDGGE
jgi:hypothetical protein